MATYDARYELAGNKAAQKGLTLYEACKALEAVEKAGNLTDATHVRCSGRAVAFFSLWHETRGVRAMFGANDEERTVLGMWAN